MASIAQALQQGSDAVLQRIGKHLPAAVYKFNVSSAKVYNPIRDLIGSRRHHDSLVAQCTCLAGHCCYPR
jgi:hypothetical protein